MTSSAYAEQPLTITISTKASPQYVSGVLTGCQLAFEVARNDPEYSRGELVYLTGSLGFAIFEGKMPAFRLKLGVKGIATDSVFAAPADAYLVDGYTTNRPDLISSFTGENGFKVFVYQSGNLTAKSAMNDPIKNKKFTFAYAMTPGGLNAIVPIDLTVEQLNFDTPEKSVISDRTATEWSSCLAAVLDAGKSRLEEQKNQERR